MRLYAPLMANSYKSSLFHDDPVVVIQRQSLAGFAYAFQCGLQKFNLFGAENRPILK
jgi:hypothetical protein